METVQDPPQPGGPVTLRARVSETYAPLASSYGPSTPQLEALQAFLEARVAGEWTDLARLLVDPAALEVPKGPTGTVPVGTIPDDFVPDATQLDEPSPTDDPLDVVRAAVDESPVCLIRAASGTAALQAILNRLASDGARTLLFAPTPEDADALEGDLAGLNAVRAERPSGDVKALRRRLLWLEQWPRDAASLAAAKAATEQRREALATAERRLTEDIEATRRHIETSAGLVEEARERLTRLGEEHRLAAEEFAKAKAAWQELQAIADRAAQNANEATRAADATHARYNELAAQATRCERQLGAERDRERTLVEELARAKEALPEANREVERLSAEAADATAEGHASYYRLAAAESARAAQRHKLSWGQRLHVAPAPPETGDLRNQVKARIREADEAGARAREATAAYEEAEMLRGGLVKFLSDGERELTATRAAQERLGKDIVANSAERDATYSGYQQQARTAGEDVDRARQAVAAARHAHQVSTAAEAHGEATRRASEEATAAAERATEEIAVGRQRLTELESGLAQQRTDGAAELDGLRSELDAVTEAEARSRDLVREICGADPSDELIAEHRTSAMARIEEMATELESAPLVYGTPGGFATGPYARGPGFDALIVTGADRLDDVDFLLGAVRARRWILIADGHGSPPVPEEALSLLDDPVRAELTERLSRSPYERAATAAPSLCHHLP